MRKYLYMYDSPRISYRSTKISEFINDINNVEKFEDEEKLTKDKLHNFFQKKTKQPSYVVSRCMRSRI